MYSKSVKEKRYGLRVSGRVSNDEMGTLEVIAERRCQSMTVSPCFYLDHVEADGCLLFEQIVAMDLEGIVCKRKDSPYKVTDKLSSSRIKVKDRTYSQAEGREESFERV